VARVQGRTRDSHLSCRPAFCGRPCPPQDRAAPRQAEAVGTRRSAARIALCALAIAAVALGHGPLALGQGHNATAPATGGAAAEAGRAAALPDAGHDVTSVVASSLAGILAGTHSAYLTMLLDRRRTRPAIAWSSYGEGNNIAEKALPDGSTALMVRITNVGQVAAVDIVSHMSTSVDGPGGEGPKPDSSSGFVGSLHPGASTDVLAVLSAEEIGRVRDGRTARLEVVLEYTAVDGRRYSCGIVGLYSGRYGVLETIWRD